MRLGSQPSRSCSSGFFLLFFSLLAASGACLLPQEDRLVYVVTVQVNEKHQITDLSYEVRRLPPREIKLQTQGKPPMIIFQASAVVNKTLRATNWGYVDYKGPGSYSTMLVFMDEYEPKPGEGVSFYASIRDRRNEIVDTYILTPEGRVITSHVPLEVEAP